jgi:hypothetical protein
MSKFNLRRTPVLPVAFLGWLILCAAATETRANPPSIRILCRPDISSARRAELAARLGAITGWRNLSFSEDGALLPGATTASKGSAMARALLRRAATGSNLLVIEDASGRPDVVFSRLVKGQWTADAESKPSVYIVQVDFLDFSRVMGDRDAIAAFNPGWGVLHEIAHAVYDARDSTTAGNAGECEALINEMRRECGLAERADYFYHFLPGLERSDFKSKFVRLAFDGYEPVTNRKRRLWIVWDADLVGGLERMKH